MRKAKSKATPVLWLENIYKYLFYHILPLPLQRHLSFKIIGQIKCPKFFIFSPVKLDLGFSVSEEMLRVGSLCFRQERVRQGRITDSLALSLSLTHIFPLSPIYIYVYMHAYVYTHTYVYMYAYGWFVSRVLSDFSSYTENHANNF